MDTESHTDAESHIELSPGYMAKFFSSFQWTVTQVNQLKNILSTCLTNPGVGAAVGISEIYGTSMILDMVYGPGDHTSEFSTQIYNETIAGLQGSLSAELKITMTSVMKEIPKLIARFCLRFELQP
jgi:hypothetical protein